MKTAILLSLILLVLGVSTSQMKAQTASISDNLIVQPVADRNVTFSLSESGVVRPVSWGLDLAWLSEANIRRGVRFMGSDVVDIVRSSFMPTDTIANGELTGTALTNTNLRLDIIDKWLSPDVKVALNSDHPSVLSWYYKNAPHWSEMIDVTAKYHEDRGYTVITASPFNEPDYSATGQGTMEDFYNIVAEMRNNPRFDNIRISGGNTLNNDFALEWYNYLDPAGLDEGNTHQLAGIFDTYAAFFEAVRANGDHATADEMHNVMDAMVGLEYGLQTGIWWGTAEYARGEFCKASHGERLGYAEHRSNWTAASVYRAPDGKVQAFGGVSERQSVSTTYRFVSEDKAVFYDGYGPQRVFTMELPAGNPGTYQTTLHTNAEKVVNITWGEDVQPAINGTYKLVNRQSGQVMEAVGTSNGDNIQQGVDSGSENQQWQVIPVSSRIGGDFSYFHIRPVAGKSMDLYNFSLENGENINIWAIGNASNQQWYLEYAEEGWFYIRSKESALCVQVNDTGNVEQWEKTALENQQWRFLPVDAQIDFDAPAAPSGLVATGNAVSIKLQWTANSENDVAGYDVLRAESAGGEYNTIGREVNATSFVDNMVVPGLQYYYKIRAVDQTLNRSSYSGEVSASATNDDDLVMHLTFDNEDTKDNTINLNHGVAEGGTFVEGKIGSGALSLDGSGDFVQLPENIANHNEISIAAWIQRTAYTVGRQIFNFSFSEDEYMYLSPAEGGQLKFAIKHNGVEQTLTSPQLPVLEWAYVVVTLGDDGAAIYVDGQLLAESAEITIRPSDINPLVNYIGLNPSTKKLFDGIIDDVRVYNYQLTGTEVTELYNDLTTAVFDYRMEESDLKVWPIPASDILHINYSEYTMQDYSSFQLFNMNGVVIKDIDMKSTNVKELDVSDVPTGIYMLRMVTSEGALAKKIVIKH
ncbi:RICIN domain-containing protein [Draconibacterium sp. IB214405]|uniref:LamG-like jellyroll fold domain-containing protein n=1 Tax=Draconibacterium sp. IB214405 TaxID=3097352 RepID=UPI002A110BA0|nr:LamG-like jellyroll fold domain-containing protein [Draconibacterium sp. IB214405]MDX8337549.1 RICIN domain-containing protein [Draconibacterium sp. IB214405]